MADAISRVTSGRSIGAFCMQHGPGAENAMAAFAQCFANPSLGIVLPMGYARRLANIEPNFNSSQAMKAFAKSAEPINIATEVGNISPWRSPSEERRADPSSSKSRPTCGTRRCRSR